MILNDYNQIVNENFDLSDYATRKCIIALKEDSEQSQMLSALSSALYDKIVDKVDKIDFGTIPRSRGDITKVDGYNNTVECLRIMRRLVEEYRQDPTVVDNVIGAIENVKERKTIFMKAYATNIEFPIMLYNLIVAAIENSVSFLIAVCIQYVKDPETNTMAAAIDRVAYHNAKDNLLYEQLVAFNDACNDGSIDKSLDYVIKTGKRISESYISSYNFEGNANRFNFDNRGPFEDPKDVPDPDSTPLHEEEPTEPNQFEVEPGFAPFYDNASADDYELDRRDVANEAILSTLGAVAVGTGIAMVGLKVIITIIIPLMRVITYALVSGYAKIGACLEVQAAFIEMNAYKLETSADYATNPKEMQEIINKQRKVADKLKKWANKFAIDDKKAEKKAREMVKKEGFKKYKVSDLQDDIPADIYNKSLLF